MTSAQWKKHIARPHSHAVLNIANNSLFYTRTYDVGFLSFWMFDQGELQQGDEGANQQLKTHQRFVGKNLLKVFRYFSYFTNP